MSRTYSNFLLFEDVLDSMPDYAPVMVQAANMLLNPITKIVDEDCGTYLGQVVDTSAELSGLIEVETGDRITFDRIITLLTVGKYKIGVRTLNTCLSHTNGGICRVCYESSFLGQTAPPVGTNLTLSSDLIYQTDVLIGNGYTKQFPLSETSDEWYGVKVVNGGSVVAPSNYTLGFDTITFNTAPPADSTGRNVVHFYKKNADPFQGYIAKTYTGALLGMQPLPSLRPLLRESLYEQLFSDSFISLMTSELTKLTGIPRTYISYVETIHSRMEKVLAIMFLYSLYSNID
jgi:hypothetical protein